MTKKEFKRAMQCGLGRCIQELQRTRDIEKYRDIVLWGCAHELAFDAQSEGTRSRYLFDLIKNYTDKTPFIKQIADCLDRDYKNSSWLFAQHCQLLGYFSSDENQAAKRTLLNCYEKLYNILIERNRRPQYGIFPERENFEELCITLVNICETKDECVNTYLKIVFDIGRLELKNSLFQDNPFEWFQVHSENKLGKQKVRKILNEKSKQSQAIEKYFSDILNSEMQREQKKSQKREEEPKTAEEIYQALKEKRKVSIFILRRWAMQQKNDSIQCVADMYQNEKDYFLRAEILRRLANKDCASVLNIDALIADSQSSYKRLQEQAFNALGYVKHEKVHTYALALLQKGEYQEEAFYMLAKNYHKGDYAIFLPWVKSIPVTYNEKINWHGPFTAVRDMFDKDGSKDAPKELLAYIYENTLCSYCRESIVKEMGRRRILTEEILRECLCDSNLEIRKYAQRKLLYRRL